MRHTCRTCRTFLVYLDQPLNLSRNMSNDIDDEPDEWDQRILKTGCYEENLALQLCHADRGDWRKCLGEMEAFRKCWDLNKNNDRTKTVNKSNEETKL